jgi:uncharacterized membrane protein
MTLVLIFGIGVVAGLRSFTAPMVVSWGAHLGWFDVHPPWAAFLQDKMTTYLLTALAIGELVMDKFPQTPSRKLPPAFAFRLVVGAFLGAAIAPETTPVAVLGAATGALGALAGTLGGYEARTRLVKKLAVPDFVVALVEDTIAVVGGFCLAALR